MASYTKECARAEEHAAEVFMGGTSPRQALTLLGKAHAALARGDAACLAAGGEAHTCAQRGERAEAVLVRAETAFLKRGCR